MPLPSPTHADIRITHDPGVLQKREAEISRINEAADPLAAAEVGAALAARPLLGSCMKRCYRFPTGFYSP